MLTRSIRKSLRHSEGQALVIACLMMLILSIAVLATVNLGHNIQERVRLQNTSDAAAYSMAAMEARAFNFYAFTNRTHASHYVTAMLWQSILSFAYFFEAFMVDMFGVIKTIAVCANPRGAVLRVICPLAQAIPVVGQILRLVNTLVNVLYNAIRVVLGIFRGANLDFIIGRLVIPAYRVMNAMLSSAAEATLAATLTQVVGTSYDIIGAHDINVDSRASRLLSGGLSACLLNRAYMGESMPTGDLIRGLDYKDHREDSKVSRAKRVMGAISNASRFPCDKPGGACAPGWVTNRKAEELIPLPASLGGIRTILGFLPDWKWGQTKMLTWRGDSAPKQPNGLRNGGNTINSGGNYIRDWKDPPGFPLGMMAQGDEIGSDDLYQIGFGPRTFGAVIQNPFQCDERDAPEQCWGDPWKGRNNRDDLPFRMMLKPSIWTRNRGDRSGAGRDGGVHHRLVTSNYPNEARPSDRPNGGRRNPYRDIGLSVYNKMVVDFPWPIPDLKLDVYVANVRPVFDGNHTWNGIVPFPNFEPGQFQSSCVPTLKTESGDLKLAAGRAQEFNQPSTWVILNKTPAELKNPGDTSGAGNNKPALLNDRGTLNFAFGRGNPAGTQVTFDNKKTDAGKRVLMGYAEGINVVSRGQAYYHRPGNWHEQPNFFNPYWRPRLAAVWQGRESVPIVKDMVSILPGPLRTLPQKMITH